MLWNWDKFVNDKVIETYNDDRTYLTIIWLNGYLSVGCTKWSVQELLKDYSLNPNDSLSGNKMIKTGRVYDRIAQNEFSKFSTKNIIDSFGYW